MIKNQEHEITCDNTQELDARFKKSKVYLRLEKNSWRQTQEHKGNKARSYKTLKTESKRLDV